MWKETKDQINKLAYQINDLEVLADEILGVLWELHIPEDFKIEAERLIQNALEKDSKDFLVQKAKIVTRRMILKTPFDWDWGDYMDRDAFDYGLETFDE